MKTADAVKAQIRRAFAAVPYPGDDNLRDSNEGEEPFLLEDAFRGKTDWRDLDAQFLDAAPDGFGSALTFFSAPAFRFYLPAYLIADLDEALAQQDPTFNLSYGLDDTLGAVPVNPRRYGAWTWREAKEKRFATFTPPEAAAIVAYLRYRLAHGWLADTQRWMIAQALGNFWLPRPGLPPEVE